MNDAENLDYYVLFAQSAALTIGLELIVLFLTVRFWFKLSSDKLPSPLLLFAGVFSSAGTLPWLWFVLPAILQPYLVFVLIGELLVWGAEAVFYRAVLRTGWGRSALLSLACNVCSFAAGLVFR